MTKDNPILENLFILNEDGIKMIQPEVLLLHICQTEISHKTIENMMQYYVWNNPAIAHTILITPSGTPLISIEQSIVVVKDYYKTIGCKISNDTIKMLKAK